MLTFAAALLVLIGLAHSLLGERYILIRLLRRPLPKLFGSDVFTRQTLRFAWHVTTVAWFGFAALLLQTDTDGVPRDGVLTTTAVVFALTAVTALLVTRGRHLSWIVFAAVSAACYLSL